MLYRRNIYSSNTYFPNRTYTVNISGREFSRFNAIAKYIHGSPSPAVISKTGQFHTKAPSIMNRRLSYSRKACIVRFWNPNHAHFFGLLATESTLEISKNPPTVLVCQLLKECSLTSCCYVDGENNWKETALKLTFTVFEKQPASRHNKMIVNCWIYQPPRLHISQVKNLQDVPTYEHYFSSTIHYLLNFKWNGSD